MVFGMYVIVYRIIEDPGLLEILAVRHQRQRPVKPDELPTR